MNALEKYLDHVIERKPVNLNIPAPPVPEGEGTFSLIVGVLRRWYIAVATFLLMCAIGLPAIWLLIKPLYSATGAIWVAPILTSILSGEKDSGGISNYQSFMNTQAEMITSSQVIIQRAADD